MPDQQFVVPAFIGTLFTVLVPVLLGAMDRAEFPPAVRFVMIYAVCLAGGAASVLVVRGPGMGDLQPIASNSAEILSAAWAIRELFFAGRRDATGIGSVKGDSSGVPYNGPPEGQHPPHRAGHRARHRP